MEEAARFLLDDAALSAQLKAMRHELTAAVTALPNVAADRDSAGDVGTTLTGSGEIARGSASAVIDAAGGRLSEALRAIEEYAKVLGEDGPKLAAAAKQLRYRGYDAALTLTRKLAPTAPRQWRLCLLLTQSLCTHHAWQHVLAEALRAGVDCVQVREKVMDGGALLQRVREVVALVDRRAAVVVNDRPDIAMLAGADGVHLGQFDMPVADARRLVGRQLIIGVSTSSLDEAEQAERHGADYCGVGPMFLTQTKRKDFIAGPHYLRAYIGGCALPHLAIGGVKPENIEMLASMGCHGVAVSSAICGANEPYAVARAILTHLPAPAATQA